MVVVAGWAVTNWTNYMVMQADNAHQFKNAADHRERIEEQAQQTEARVDQISAELTKSREKLTEINVLQQVHGKTLKKIDKKLDRVLTPRSNRHGR